MFINSNPDFGKLNGLTFVFEPSHFFNFCSIHIEALNCEVAMMSTDFPTHETNLISIVSFSVKIIE